MTMFGLLLTAKSCFDTTTVTEHNQISTTTVAQSSSTPPLKKAEREETLPSPTPICSPLPTPLSEQERNNPVRDLTLEDVINGFGGTPDFDCDGVCNIKDTCLIVYNPNQKDSNGDGKGDACDPKLVGESFVDSRCDRDGDGIADLKDNCPAACNPNQKFVDNNENNVNDLCDSVLPNFIANQPCDKRRKVTAPKPTQPKKP